MAPDLIPIDPSSDDDARLLAAIERAWPVPPLPARMKEPVMATPTPASPGNLIAPIAVAPARRSWGVLARIAAVIALVLAGMAALTHDRGPERGEQVFLQAPSPERTDCTTPLRSREDLEALIADAAANIPPDPEYLRVQLYSTLKMSPATEQERAILVDIVEEQQRCMQNGVPYARLTSISDAYIEFFIGRSLRTGWTSEAVLEQLMTPEFSAPPQDQPNWEYQAGQDGDQLILYAGVPNPDYADGLWFVLENGQWVMDGAAIVLGPWSSLGSTVAAKDVSSDLQGCDVARSIRMPRDVQALNERLSNEGHRPPADTAPAILAVRGGVTMSSADQKAVTSVVDAYRQCLQAGYEPFQFTQTSDSFFQRFYVASEEGGTEIHYGSSGDLSPMQQSLIPNQIQRVIQLDDGSVVAILEPNPQRPDLSDLSAGVLLVNANGTWLIDQLVLVKDG